MPAQQQHRPLTAFEMDAPLAQAARCLDLWLKEEGRDLSPRQRQKAAALIARYFFYEDCTTDALIMSFLRHYAGFRAIDMEDPASVRQALKTVLDQSVIAEPLPSPFFFITYVCSRGSGFSVPFNGCILFPPRAGGRNDFTDAAVCFETAG